ncbi:uncharacterized protein phrf1 isoform X2 [Genypterus blacodes]|uniref:uncharacterized protein phrf1 isoform X2 n=1 Tax=Genypterus blacodes TaxID=154954 RepID=UPI003F771BA1
MDEDDSQDELINRNTSLSKGKRAAAWAISDDSDDNEEGDSNSGEEDEEDRLNGEEDEDDEEEEEDDDEGSQEEEEEDKAEEGAVGGTSADGAGFSSDEDAEKCPICLNSFSSQPVATPESCEHYFCLDCILAWSKNANSCPVDRISFDNIYLRKCYGGKVQKMITVQKPVKEVQEEVIDLDLEQTNCEVCGGSDREDRLLLCDGCDAGYHMECLTPPLNAVPVEEWFCPECEANNRQSRGSAEDISESESHSSSFRPVASHSRPRTAGPTRAIARTQQSERVRANVNRHRITQARTAQLAPTFLMRSTWLDETINAVVAGLNTAVYIRDLTPRAPSTRRRHTKRRRKRTSAAGSKGKAAGTGVKRRRRRKTKSRKKFGAKKQATTRGRIASSLGIAKPKNGSSLPTVYRPSEHTLSNMRADIGAASLSIYGDPFDLDPFVDREEAEEQQVQVTSLLEAKRRGISRSALRSHQPVARPITASISRRSLDIPSTGGVVETAPVPDLLGSILSGQSMLMMDSSDVVINRDGTLKATKPLTLQPALIPGSSHSSVSGDAQVNPGMSPNPGADPFHLDQDLPGPSRSSVSRPLCQGSPCSSPFRSSATGHAQPVPRSDLPTRGHRNLQPPFPNRPKPGPGHHPTHNSHSKSSSLSQPKPVPTKPMWVDVSALPRIPKKKRETGDVTNDCSSPDGSNGQSSRSSRGISSSAANSSNNYGIPETGMNSLAGDRSRQRSVERQRGKANGQTQRPRPDGAGPSSSSSSTFANSFSSSSSSTSSPASQPCFPSVSSASSSAVSFRINASGNLWHSRRPSNASSTGSSTQEHPAAKEDEAKKKRMRKDKQMLLAARTPGGKEQERNTIYDPFDPTASDSTSSDEERETKSPDADVRRAPPEISSPGKKEQSKRGRVHQAAHETQEIKVKHEGRSRASPQHGSQEATCSEENDSGEKDSRFADTKAWRQTIPDIKIKQEPGLEEMEIPDHCVENSLTRLPHPGLIKTEKQDLKEESRHRAVTPSSAPPNCKTDSSTSASGPTKHKHKMAIKVESKSPSKSPSRDVGHGRTASRRDGPSKQPLSESSSSETGRGKKADQQASGQGGSSRGADRERDGTSERSRERRRRRSSTSDSSRSDSSDRSRRKKRRPRSRSKDRRRSRSGSASGSREHPGKKPKPRSKERSDGRDRDSDRGRASKDKRHGRSRSKSRSKSSSRSRSVSKERRRGRSRSKSRSRSRSRERRKEHAKPQSSSSHPRDKVDSRSADKKRHRSRSSSRERRKEGRAPKSSQKASGACVSSSKDPKPLKEKKKDKDVSQSSKSSKGETVARVIKEEPSYPSVSKVKKEGKDTAADNKTLTAERVKEPPELKEIKKEKKTCFDMFEDSPSVKAIKKEEEAPCSIVKKEIEKDRLTSIRSDDCETIKTETHQITIKSEPMSPPLCHHFSPDVASFSAPSISSPVAAETLPVTPAPPQPAVVKTLAEQPDAAAPLVPVKQEAEQPPDSDDDFNVDVMLDNLDLVKSEQAEAEGSGVSVKQEKEPEEVKNDGEQAAVTAGTKTKPLVKRVTWNIQEPEGPQPEKSASKLALYKLKLKQEGARRISLSSQASSQDAPGDPGKKGGAVTGSSSSEGKPTTDQAQGTEAEEGDVSRKDMYLKKLHMQERAIEEVKIAIKPFYQKRDINKDEYKDIVRKAVQKVCHSKSGEINPVKVGNLVKAYVDKYKHARKHKKAEDPGEQQEDQNEALNASDSP